MLFHSNILPSGTVIKIAVIEQAFYYEECDDLEVTTCVLKNQKYIMFVNAINCSILSLINKYFLSNANFCLVFTRYKKGNFVN